MVFPFGDLTAAEKTTCIGRQSLRLMISHFKNIGYTPIVGDSFTGDTPLFIKYDSTNMIDIKPVEELICETETDALGREYDTSKKPFKVLCRGGWMYPEYIYRHKTEKPLYEVSEGNMSITVTEDHSLFNENREKIKPSEINVSTKLEYYDKKISGEDIDPSVKHVITMAKMVKNGTLDRVPISILNMEKKQRIQVFLDVLGEMDYSKISKTCMAGIQFLKNKLKMGLKTLT